MVWFVVLWFGVVKPMVRICGGDLWYGPCPCLIVLKETHISDYLLKGDQKTLQMRGGMLSSN